MTRRLTGNAEMAPGDAAKIKKLLGVITRATIRLIPGDPIVPVV